MGQLAERVPVVQRKPQPVAKRSPTSELHPRSTAGPQSGGAVAGRVASPVSEVVGGLPGRLRAGVEGLSGLAMDDVRVHRNSSEPAKLGALAFTRGTEIHLGPGQEQHLPHEAWHVVQQKQGRVQATTQMKGAAVNDDAGLEREADRMGAMASRSMHGRTVPSVLQRAVASVVQRQAAKRPAKTPVSATSKDRPVDVVEAIVHVMSNRGLSGDVGPKGENISSPLYASEVAKTVQEAEHKALIWAWYRIAIGDPTTHGDRAKIAEANTKTASLIAQAKADPSTRSAADVLGKRYVKGFEELDQRGAREQVDKMLDAGVHAAKLAEWAKFGASDDAQLKSAVGKAREVVAKGVSVARRVLSGSTSAKQKAAHQARVDKWYAQTAEASFKRALQANPDAPVPWPESVKRAAGMNLADGLFVLQGGLDAASAILAVTDPKAREALFRARSNYFGTVAQGATINKILWQFVSGTITVAGVGAYAVTKLAGKVKLAEKILDTTIKGISNVGAAINLAGVVHGAFVLADPEATPDEKAEAAVEVAYSGIGLTGFASRWVPRLAGFARWSGPISASLVINFEGVKWLGRKGQGAKVGLSRLAWAPGHKATKAAAIEVQDWQRRLAVAIAILATETDSRRKDELRKYAQAFRYGLIEQQLKPFVEARLASKSMDDDSASCGRAFTKRLAPVQGMLGSASTSDDAALAASAAFLLIVEKAFAEWDQIVMDKSAP